MAVLDDRSRRAVQDALNGDIDSVDSAVRRALFALTTELDEHAASQEHQHKEFQKSINQLRNLLISTTVSFVLALGAGVMNLVIG